MTLCKQLDFDQTACFTLFRVKVTQSSRWMAVFLRKSGLPSHACGCEQFLLKPTCFHEDRRRRSVRAETSMSRGVVLLDHLFHRNITSVHVAKWLIPRFVTSNPSPSYFCSVVDAFRSGAYDGKTYSGSYSDLGVTIAAILLHPEARSSSVFRDSFPFQFATFCFGWVIFMVHPFVDCVYNICLFELSSCASKIALLVLTIVILELVLGCQEGQSLSFHLHPTCVRRCLCCCSNA